MTLPPPVLLDGNGAVAFAFAAPLGLPPQPAARSAAAVNTLDHLNARLIEKPPASDGRRSRSSRETHSPVSAGSLG